MAVYSCKVITLHLNGITLKVDCDKLKIIIISPITTVLNSAPEMDAFLGSVKSNYIHNCVNSLSLSMY